MQNSDIPPKFPIPFAAAAGGGFVRPIPVPSQIGLQDGAASLTTGFPPLNFSPISAGGVPPFGQDMNGILKQITQWSRWEAAGSQVQFDASFSAQIGGYPQGAILASTATTGLMWISTVENNTSNPDAGGANWTPFLLTSPTRIITVSGAISPAIALADESIGFNRSGASSGALPASQPGKVFYIEDLADNFSTSPVTISAPAGQSFGIGTNTFVCNENGQSVRFRYYGSNLWSVKR